MTPETLRATRLSLGLTQTQLGARLGVTLRQIQRWEAGDIQIPRGFVVAVRLLEELEDRNGATLPDRRPVHHTRVKSPTNTANHWGDSHEG